MDQVISEILHLAAGTAGSVIPGYPPRLIIRKPLIFHQFLVFVISTLVSLVAA